MHPSVSFFVLSLCTLSIAPNPKHVLSLSLSLSLFLSLSFSLSFSLSLSLANMARQFHLINRVYACNGHAPRYFPSLKHHTLLSSSSSSSSSSSASASSSPTFDSIASLSFIPRKKTNLGKSLAEDYAYNPIWVSTRVSDCMLQQCTVSRQQSSIVPDIKTTRKWRKF